MLTRRMDEKIEELKTFFNSKLEEKLGEQEKNLTNTLNNLISDLRNEFKKELQNEINKQYEKLESENKMLRKQVSELHKLNIENQTNNEDLEQYDRHLCLRIDGVPVVENETSVDVLASVKKLFDDAQVEIPDAVIDRAHRIGGNYVDRKSKKSCKSIIVRFTTFRHRTMFYRAKSKLKNGTRVKLDLTKSRLTLLNKANEHVQNIPSINFCYADVNCRLKVKFKDAKQKDMFFSSFEELQDIADAEL